MSDDHEPTPPPPDDTDPTGVTHLVVGLVVGSLEGLAWLLEPTGDGDGDPDDGRPGTPPPGPGAPLALPPGTTERAGELAAGVVFGARDVAVATGRLAGQTLGAATTVARGVARLPGVDRLTAPLITAADAVAERGRRELERSDAARADALGTVGRRLGDDVVPAATEVLAEGPLVDVLGGILPVALEEIGRDPDALTGLVEQVLPGILDSALPAVLDQLASDPDLLLPLVGAVVDRVLPDIIGQLGEDPELIMGVVDPLLPEVLAKLGEDPEPLLAMVNELLPPLLDDVLPLALDQLNEDPTVVRNLVLDQSGGMATEMANTVRSRAVAADALVDRIGRRLLRRPQRPLPLSADEAPAALGPGQGGAPAPPSADLDTTGEEVES